MADQPTEALSALRGIWQQEPDQVDELDAECGPTKACRNMKDVTFDGFAEEGVDLATAWRNKLAREGKLAGQSLADLMLERAE